ncbi:MAG: carboxypeptidase-like regulatory domain-containing protein [Crocinitomicaceae bacterium]|nr:carboxypeptidase-like regulatory domain-containing protein [Crocinitomicaceae bacterium]
MKKVALLAVLSLFLITACKKGPAEFVLKGTITDATFNASLTNATVKLYATGAGSSVTNEIASTTLDSEGNYQFTFEREKVETYYLEVVKENYFDLYETIPFSDLTIEDDNVYDFSTTAKGWVRFNISHPGGVPGDVLEYIREEGKIDCAECCPGGYRYFYGAVDSTFYCVNDGNAAYSGYYWATGSSGGSGPVWVQTPPFDTVDIYISY